MNLFHYKLSCTLRQLPLINCRNEVKFGMIYVQRNEALCRIAVIDDSRSTKLSFRHYRLNMLLATLLGAIR